MQQGSINNRGTGSASKENLSPIEEPAARPRDNLTRTIWGLTLVTLLLGVCAVGLSIWHDYRMTIEADRRMQAEIVRMMVEHTRGVLNTDAILLNRIEELVRGHDLAVLAKSPQLRQELIRLRAETPNVASLWILDKDGLPVATTIPDVPQLNYQDREYFQVARASAKRFDYISPLIVGKVSGRAIFSVTRRLNDAAGQFAGVMQVNINADDFIRVYADVSEHMKDSFGVYKLDGSIVLRQPLPELGMHSDKARDRLAERAMGPKRGSFIAVSVFDGIQRQFVYQVIPEAGLILTAGRAMTDVLTPWRERNIRNGAGALVGLAVIGFLAVGAIRAARRAEEAQQALLIALRSRATFFASASHDLRQPYQALRLLWTVADQRVKTNSDTKLRSVVEKMGTAMMAGEQLLSTLLDVAVLEAGHIVPRLQNIALGELVEAEAVTFQTLAQSRGLRLRWVDSTLRVDTDPVLLRRILRNLIVNAIKFTEQGGVLIGCRRHAASVTLEVWDTGKGIAKEHGEAVFEDLFQVENQSRTSSEGLGLGLSIVVRTAQLLGYKIGLQSRPGLGSVFSVTLPLPQNAEPVPPQDLHRTGRGERIRTSGF